MKKKMVRCLFFFLLLVSANQAVEGINPAVSFSGCKHFLPVRLWGWLQMKQELPNWNIVEGILEHSAVQLTLELNTDVSAGILFEESPCCQEFFILIHYHLKTK